MRSTVVVGVDVGGTKIAGALVTREGIVLESQRVSSVVDGRCDPDLTVTESVVRELLARARVLEVPVEGIGAAFPEYVEPGGRLTSREVVAWSKQPYDVLSPLAPLVIDSDVRCAALGEARFGHGRTYPDFVYVSVGTGLSHALVCDGRVRQGARGEAIAFGELRLAGVSGRLEDVASGRAIANGVSVAEAATALVTGLATVVGLFDPGAIVLGGGVAVGSHSRGSWWADVEREYETMLRRRPGAPPLLRSMLGADAGVVGAAERFRSDHREHAAARSGPGEGDRA